ncbi:membrane integrity-associated transporter subunit PqiC [Candidatus Eisenbacteria bacterium]|uniref:Membrane integrity-associated transporter subunit PqiC n=1 Tax=Eiseniibacteriota bacterium TaxID=2212470 RepID=A0ABV6YPF8_UNCEI
MKFQRAHIAAAILIMIALLCLSCGSKQARYYMLSSSPGLDPVSSSAEPVTVGVGPVGLPDYLMRPEMVTRPGASEVRLAEFDRWVEPLDDTVLRVLADNLSDLLPSARILTYPWNRAIPVDYRITIDVTSFEQQPDGKVHLSADWSLLFADGKAEQKGETRLTAEVASDGYQAIVSAMNAALAQLSEELGAAVSGGMPKP